MLEQMIRPALPVSTSSCEKESTDDVEECDKEISTPLRGTKVQKVIVDDSTNKSINY